ncbi:MAG: sugar phosphate isomerase/epimerase [Roseburia sp.]|nr:sugar phosphate isomerase/epimerase [Roseburia sp.]
MDFSMYAGFTQKIRNDGMEEAAKYARRLKFSSVEVIADFYFDSVNAIPTVEAAGEAKKVLDQYGLPVACYSVGINLWNRTDSEQILMEQIDIAHALGSPYLHHTLLPWLTLDENSPEPSGAIMHVVEIASRVADYAKTKGMCCIYEDQGYYVNGVGGYQFFYDEMKKRCENIGVCGDLGNILFVNEKPEAFLRAFANEIKHVHVKDYLWKCGAVSPGRYWMKAKGDSWLRDTMVGSGVIDFAACMQILKDAGYSGRFALENVHPEPYEEGVRQAMELVERLYAPERSGVRIGRQGECHVRGTRTWEGNEIC